MERLRSLEALVKELSSQLDQANTGSGSEVGGSAPPAKCSPVAGGQHQSVGQDRGPASVGDQFGRLVLKDANRSRYVSSGFWSRVDLYGLKMDLAGHESDSSEKHHYQSAPSTQELDRSPSERHSFLFRHNLSFSPADAREFHPLPSQVPFLLNTYSENVNLFMQVVHIPTITKRTRKLRGSDSSELSPSDEALLFSIYYAAIISMEDDDVITNFGTTKGELSLKYRLGLEHALAKADFLNKPNLTLVQAFDIFLALARRHDSPRFVWMMTGLAIRMAQSLGLHRDGSRFPQLTPYEIEIRRRVWWALCFLDVRSSEDQGMDYTIVSGSFDTKFPLNLNDADIDTETRETPPERQGLTAMSISIDLCKICDVTRQIMDKARAPTLHEQRRLVDELYRTLERGYLRYSNESDGGITWWVGITSVRLTMAKMTLFINFPVLFSLENEESAIETRNRLLVAAIEVAEWNHALNAEQEARQWRWIYQTYTHWHSIVLLLIEIARRPLSPMVERAWLALRSRWLIPSQGNNWDQELQIWVPLRKLMAQARKHRDAEIERLRASAEAIEQTAAEDGDIPAPASTCPFMSQEDLQGHWRSLFTSFNRPSDKSQASTADPTGYSMEPATVVEGAGGTPGQYLNSLPVYGEGGEYSRTSVEKSQGTEGEHLFGQNRSPPFPQVPATWPGRQHFDTSKVPWLWADADPTVDVFGTDLDINMDSEIDWQDWLESARKVELNSDMIQ
ncbi:hypothetical protein N0V82_000970 [Gnomoniopsis sp. IMI 355080]|nr:hypothetical protein N0V82_000970 [Gnomoniopsis sp. IMI 355080]